MRAPGLILAAPASSSGKTLVTLGLLRHLRRRGLRVAAAKAGPDYIDPTFLAAASGAPCVNLDPWAMRPAALAGLVGRLEAESELVVCEGVMGLFDGTGATGETGSTAELARLTGWPVVLVIDASGQGASAAALARGFALHDPDLPLAAIILNRVAGGRHRALVEGALARHLLGIARLGAVAHDPGLTLPARHLGLIPAGERPGAAPVIERAAELVEAGLDIGRLIALAAPSRLEQSELLPGVPPIGNHIAVARDDAFVFIYAGQLAAWRAQGATVSFFSPLADEAPDPGAAAVFLPGGYPELHAGRLAAAAAFRAGLRQAAAAGKPVYGECGGYMALGDALTDADGRAHRMAGLLPMVTSFAEPRLHLGYRQAVLLSPGPLGPRGGCFRGHEFHYATTARQGPAEPLLSVTDATGRELGIAGMRCGPVFGSFVHLIDASGKPLRA
ncbi:MAG: cobyrinate a,c-diamide synthase [Alphaproteobacteria bacterium]|nr:cobyrinate a,c-diamide synthase [Alphaproteobacteria bacterium]